VSGEGRDGVGKTRSSGAGALHRDGAVAGLAGDPFYRKRNQLLAEAQFDRRVEELCRPHYAEGVGRPSIAPGVYFRMLFVGYFEGIDSQRGIAWRCRDSRSLQEFLGLGMTQETPDHSSLTDIRQRLPSTVHEEVFRLLLEIASQKGVLRRGKSLGVNSKVRAQANLLLSGGEERVDEAVADEGYHAAETLRKCQVMGVRAYIRERKCKHPRRWRDKQDGLKAAVYATRRRVA